jgi:hypothetical protein
MKATQAKTIDLTIYKIKRIIDGSEVYNMNTCSTAPSVAREMQKIFTGNHRSRKVIYTPPNSKPFSLLVLDRHIQPLSALSDGKWHLIESLKGSHKETRKAISELRQLGIHIGTRSRPWQYKLFGEIELYPMGLGVGIQSISNVLPSVSECNLIDDARRHLASAKREANDKKRAAFIEGS